MEMVPEVQLQHLPPPHTVCASVDPVMVKGEGQLSVLPLLGGLRSRASVIGSIRALWHWIGNAGRTGLSIVCALE